MLVGSAAATFATAPAVVAPSIAQEATAIDPIFAAIEAHRKAFRIYVDAMRALDDIEHAMPDDLLEGEKVQVGWRHGWSGREPLYSKSHEHIDAYFDSELAPLNAGAKYTHERHLPDRAEIELRRTSAHAALDIEADRIAEQLTEWGWRAANDAFEAADESEGEAMDMLIWNLTPTTIAGTSALARYLLSHQVFLNRDALDNKTGAALQAIERATAGLLGVPAWEPSASEAQSI